MKFLLFAFAAVVMSCKQLSNTSIDSNEVCSKTLLSSTPRVIEIEEIDSSNLKEGSIITTKGYMYLNMEDVAIYPNSYRESEKMAYWLNFNNNLSEHWGDLKKMNGKKVMLSGYINYKRKGHLNSYSGEIDSVFCVKLAKD